MGTSEQITKAFRATVEEARQVYLETKEAEWVKD